MKPPILMLILALAGCENSSQLPHDTATDSPAVDSWLGRWNGPEGTFLEISPDGVRYSIKIQNLDGPSTYVGMLRDGRLTFERNGKVETISATDGKATGMKWLLDKQNCLTIKTGEGFCRD